MNKFRESNKTERPILNRKAYIVKMPMPLKTLKELHLLRITLTSEETKIDFGYLSKNENKPSILSLEKTQVYLHSKEIKKKWQLHDISNFNNITQNNWGFFTLHFSPLLEILKTPPFQENECKPVGALKDINLIINNEKLILFENLVLNDFLSIYELDGE